MIDDVYKNAFKEVYEILSNTDEELIKKIPNKFIEFLKTNMNSNFETNIKTDIEIDKQPLLSETEAILALIYRSYWAENNNTKKSIIPPQRFKNADEIFSKKRNLTNITLNTDLIAYKSPNIIQKFFKKIFSLFRK